MADIERLYVNGEVLLYGDVGDPWGWGDGFTPGDVAKCLALHGSGDVTVRINSGGGIAWDGTAIYSLLRAHAGKVTVVIDGIAASAASAIAMAGDAIEMRGGALMMIHDASAITWGTAADHEKSRDMLDKLSGQYARIYSDRSGRSEDEVRAMMLEETWLTAEEAVANGLATAVLSDAAQASAAFDYRIYAHAPAALPRRGKAAATPTTPSTTAADAALTKEPSMASNTPSASASEPTADKTTAPAAKSWLGAFYASAEKSGVPLADLNVFAAESQTIEQAQARVIDAMASARNADKPSVQPTGAATVTADARDRFKEGAIKAISAKVGLKGGERNEFSSFSMRELARASLDLRGEKYVGRSAENMMKQAFAAVGGHSTSDFVDILANVANKSMLKGFEEADETYESWTARGSLPDFKPQRRVDLNLFDSLAKVEEGGEYTQGSVTDRAEEIMLAKYGRTFHITWEAMINDDLDVMSKLPARYGRASKRTIGNLVYAVLNGNPNLRDGQPIFAAGRNNLATGAPSALSQASLDAGRTAMARQKDPEGKAAALNIRPKTLLVPVALVGLARQLMDSTTDISQANPAVGSRVAGMAEIVSDARLDDASATRWFLAGDPNIFDTIEVAYLDGVSEPEMFEDESFKIDGTSFKIRLVAGVAPLGFRALYRANGA
jgi:ATP-dependent protease ClpP protease subunit